ncbi:uncharacterized protein NEMAJ01_0404 [Nematocida major]|uniref:uncharacterized protein n=1 Tax=Nematocida major TaxID=1912982 RepID=UPI0020080A5B|nr:uncharacterized protein NEMAJ01_0404 [Nematocida major]KAH9385508.1 hypothetical protein NEMAJ01_0404 [Nematocida major]
MVLSSAQNEGKDNASASDVLHLNEIREAMQKQEKARSQRCGVCGSTEHVAAQCARAKKQEEESVDRENGSQRSPSIDIDMRIGSISTQCKLVSSSDLNTMSWKLYTELTRTDSIIRDVPTLRKIRLPMQAGRDCSCREILVQVACKGKEIGTHLFYVMPPSSTQYTTLNGNLFGLLASLQLLDAQECSSARFCGVRQISSTGSGYTAAYHASFVESVAKQSEGGGMKDKKKCTYLSQDTIYSILQEVDQTKKTGEILPVHISTKPGEIAHEFKPVSKPKEKIAKEKVQEMLQEGLIEECRSCKWLSPVHIAKKDDGEWLFCLNMRALNALTVKEPHTIPKVSTIIDDLHGMKYLSKIKLKNSCFMVPLKKESMHKTTFKLGKSFYRFKVLPLGYKNTSKISQRVVESILVDFVGRFCRVYMDDILVYSTDLASHEKHLKEVLKKFKQYGMDIFWEKCELAKTEMNFLGYHIEHNTVGPLESRVHSISEFPVPRNKKQLRRFMGLLGYDRRFLYNISETLLPLSMLAKKSIPWCWKDLQSSAFEEAKRKLMNTPGLAAININKNFTLEVDANYATICAVLVQENRAVGYYSKILTDVQKRYADAEKKILSIVWGCSKCARYLYEREFYLQADHQVLAYYQKNPEDASARMKKWIDTLKQHRFFPKYKQKK